MSHYSKGQRPRQLWSWAKTAAYGLHHMMLSGEYPALIYRGMSGIASATALSIAWEQAGYGELAMAYVRKENETSHGEPVETDGGDPTKVAVLCFVDDFVASGNTERAAMKKAIGYLSIGASEVRRDYYIRVESGDPSGSRGGDINKRKFPVEWQPASWRQQGMQREHSITETRVSDANRLQGMRPDYRFDDGGPYYEAPMMMEYKPTLYMPDNMASIIKDVVPIAKRNKGKPKNINAILPTWEQ